MPAKQGKPPGGSLGEKSNTEGKHSGHAIHRSGTHVDAMHAEVEEAITSVKRPAHPAPASVQKKGGL